jgi:hypothetical protein
MVFQKDHGSKIMQGEQLQQLAQQLKRPVMSLNEFSTLSDEQLAWLNQQVSKLCAREEAQLQQSLVARLAERFSILGGSKSRGK